MAARHPPRRAHLRLGLQRAGGRLRPRGAPHPRHPRRRRLGRQWTEAVVHRRRQGGVHVACGADRSGREEACRHQRADGRSSLARRHHPAEPCAVRQDLQRTVLRQRAGAGDEHGRRGEQRLEGHHRRARRRACHDRRRAHGGHRARVRSSHRIPENCGGRRQGSEKRSGDPRSDRRAGRRHRGCPPVSDPERAAGRARQGADPRSGHGQGVRERIAGAARPGCARYPRHRVACCPRNPRAPRSARWNRCCAMPSWA